MRFSFCLSGFLACAIGFAQEPRWPEMRPILVAEGFALPVDIQSPDDGSGRLFVVEQRGTIRIIERGRVLPDNFLDLRSRVVAGGERGLLGIAFPADFANKRHFYVNYTEGGNAPNLRSVIARYQVSDADPNLADPGSEERLLVVEQPFNNHNGGALRFSPRDGMLYIGFGDGGSANDPQNFAQNNNSLLGKMLRIDVEAGVSPYQTPASNPFVNRQGYRAEIWATGLRNPWRYSFDRLTGDLWIADVGQNRREEVHFQAAASEGGENYGWKILEGSLCLQAGCNPAGLVQPVFEYGRDEGVSITGGNVYRGTALPWWQGNYFVADFGTARFWAIQRDGDRLLNRTLGRREGWAISTFGEDEQGEIYFAEYGSGAIYRMADETPATREDKIMNHASGERGVTPGGRVVIAGWGVSSEPGRVYAQSLADETLGGFRVLFGDVPGKIAEVFNVGGEEAIVAIAPAELAGRETVRIVVERGGRRSEPVETKVSEVQPGLYWGVVDSAAAGAEITLLGTGFGPAASDGACVRPVEVRFGDTAAVPAACRSSRDYAGVVELTLRVPALQPGEYSLTASVSGVDSRPILFQAQ